MSSAHSSIAESGALPSKFVIRQSSAVHKPGCIVKCAALTDGSRLLLTTHWRSYEAVVAVDVDSKAVSRVTPDDEASWLLLCVGSGARFRPNRLIVHPHARAADGQGPLCRVLVLLLPNCVFYKDKKHMDRSLHAKPYTWVGAVPRCAALHLA